METGSSGDLVLTASSLNLNGLVPVEINQSVRRYAVGLLVGRCQYCLFCIEPMFFSLYYCIITFYVTILQNLMDVSM